MDNRYEDYRGLRILLMTRVSTPRQEDGYGHPSQERALYEKLVEPIKLKVVDIVRDTYTGLEFRHRPMLDEILERAKRGEFDIFGVDVLDRLGRKGLEREIWRMQLRATGVRMLTTDPEERADDDSSWGELIRIFKGMQAEDELKNIVRRTMNGKRAKAEGRQADGTIGQKKLVGNAPRLYGYKYLIDERGKKYGFIVNEDKFKDINGKEWTEAKIVNFIFESIAEGKPIRQVVIALNAMGIPTPSIARNQRSNSRKVGETKWQPSVINRTVHNSAYWGEYRQFRFQTEKVPGRKHRKAVEAPESQQVVIPVPPIVSQELKEAVCAQLQKNKEDASRNNRRPRLTLLRSGLAKCGLCGGNMHVTRRSGKRMDGTIFDCFGYKCNRSVAFVDKCTGVYIGATCVDNAAWKRALEVISNPSEVDAKLAALRSEDPTEDRRKKINNKLADIRRKLTAFRERLAEMMMQDDVDQGTIVFLKDQLRQLTEQEHSWKSQLAQEKGEYEKWKKIDEKLTALHQKCAEIREKMDDPNYESSYEEKRDILKFLGITAIIYGGKANPPYEIQCNPPDIMFLLS